MTAQFFTKLIYHSLIELVQTMPDLQLRYAENGDAFQNTCIAILELPPHTRMTRFNGSVFYPSIANSAIRQRDTVHALPYPYTYIVLNFPFSAFYRTITVSTASVFYSPYRLKSLSKQDVRLPFLPNYYGLRLCHYDDLHLNVPSNLNFKRKTSELSRLISDHITTLFHSSYNRDNAVQALFSEFTYLALKHLPVEDYYVDLPLSTSKDSVNMQEILNIGIYNLIVAFIDRARNSQTYNQYLNEPWDAFEQVICSVEEPVSSYEHRYSKGYSIALSRLDPQYLSLEVTGYAGSDPRSSRANAHITLQFAHHFMLMLFRALSDYQDFWEDVADSFSTSSRYCPPKLTRSISDLFSQALKLSHRRKVDLFSDNEAAIQSLISKSQVKKSTTATTTT